MSFLFPHRKNGETKRTSLFTSSVVILVAYVKTHQTVYFKCIHFIVCPSSLIQLENIVPTPPTQARSTGPRTCSVEVVEVTIACLTSLSPSKSLLSRCQSVLQVEKAR